MGNTVDTVGFRAALQAVREHDVRAFRQRWNIAHNATVGLFCGSLYPEKHLEFLVDAARIVRALRPDFELVIAGAGPQADLARRLADSADWIHYVGPVFGSDKAACFKTAQVFLNPGLVGLSIVDAFCASLPVFSTDVPIHSPEIEYLQPGVNGLITAFDPAAYAQSVVSVLSDRTLSETLRRGAAASAEALSPDAMVDSIATGILGCLESPPLSPDLPTSRRTAPVVTRLKSLNRNNIGWRIAAMAYRATLSKLPVDLPRAAWPAPQAEHAGGLAANKRIVLLTNTIPPYRVAALLATRKRVGALKVLIGGASLTHLTWERNWEGLDVEVQRTLTIPRTYRHPDGFRERANLVIPYDTLWRLIRLKPDVVIAAELGARSAQAALYRNLFPRSRLIIHADLCEPTERAYGGLRTRMRALLLRQADAIVVNGESGARYIKGLGVSDTRIFRVPYCTDMSLFSSAQTPTARTPIQSLIYSGQLVERKGLLPFLRHLSDWLERNAARKVELRIVGDGPLRERLASAPRHPNLHLTMIGPVAYEALPELYASADCLVLPTLADTWGLVVNEALATGLPVLGSNRSQAVEELIQNGRNGWVFSPDSPEQIAAALDSALGASPEELDRIRRYARESVAGITPDFVAQKIEQAIAGSYAHSDLYRTQSGG
jgi:glycosyltransferase involved in cell wall biosynthesis